MTKISLRIAEDRRQAAQLLRNARFVLRHGPLARTRATLCNLASSMAAGIAEDVNNERVQSRFEHIAAVLGKVAEMDAMGLAWTIADYDAWQERKWS